MGTRVHAGFAGTQATPQALASAVGAKNSPRKSAFQEEVGQIFQTLRKKAGEAFSFFTKFLLWELSWGIPGFQGLDPSALLLIPHLGFKCQPLKPCLLKIKEFWFSSPQN